MKVQAKKRFYDRKEKELRLPNDEFVVSKERGEDLSSLSFVIEVKEEKKEDKKKSGG